MTVMTVGSELPVDERPGSPVAQRTFAHWPLPVGRVEIRDGLAFVYARRPEGFTRDDLHRIPDDGRIELLDGIAVVSPAPTRLHQRVLTNLAVLLHDITPPQLETLVGPYDIRISAVKMFEPDVVVLPRDDDQAALLVVEILSTYGRRYDRRVKFAGYREAGIPSYWIVDPDGPSVTVFELARDGSYQETLFVEDDETCAVARPFPVRFRPADLVL
jgi:Uma2 family endonuclease